MAEMIKYESPQLQLIRRELAPTLTPDQFELFIEYCKRSNLDPLKRQIYSYAVNDKTTGGKKMVVLTSIDGYRSIALRTGRYMGQTPQEWCGKDGKWVDIWLKAEQIGRAHV